MTEFLDVLSLISRVPLIELFFYLTWQGPKKRDKGGMARRKQEVQLQQEIETQDEWEEMLGKDGLYGK